MVRFRLTANPAQDEVNRRNEFDFHCIRVQGVLARSEGRTPNTAVTGFDLLAVTKRFAGGIVASRTMVGNDHTDIADWNQSLGLNFHRSKPAVDKECAVRQNLQLFTAFTTQL